MRIPAFQSHTCDPDLTHTHTWNSGRQQKERSPRSGGQVFSLSPPTQDSLSRATAGRHTPSPLGPARGSPPGTKVVSELIDPLLRSERGLDVPGHGKNEDRSPAPKEQRTHLRDPCTRFHRGPLQHPPAGPHRGPGPQWQPLPGTAERGGPWAERSRDTPIETRLGSQADPLGDFLHAYALLSHSGPII